MRIGKNNAVNAIYLSSANRLDYRMYLIEVSNIHFIGTKYVFCLG